MVKVIINIHCCCKTGNGQIGLFTQLANKSNLRGIYGGILFWTGNADYWGCGIYCEVRFGISGYSAIGI